MPIMHYIDLIKNNKASHLYGIRVFMSGEYMLSNLTIHEDRTQTTYYGFCVDKNHRFLLGDNTVTHNTVMALNIISILKKKTLVIVHKEFLMDQWKERIKQFLPNARIGRIQGQIVDIENKDIVLGMLQSLSMKEYPGVKFDNHFGLTIVDEVHHISAEVFCRSLFKIVTTNMLGLSATMTRKDGLTKVFKMFLGRVVYKEERSKDDAVTVRSINYRTNDEDFSKTVYNFKGQTHYAIMIRKLCEFNLRSEFILKVLKDTLGETPDQQIMILAHNKSLLKYLHDAIEYRKIATVGYYIGGMKQKALKETEGKQVVIATYAMAEEALDIKSLATLIMATPKTSVEQAVGRILRMKHKNPLVIDIVDQHDIFQKQWIKRRRFYIKHNYKIITSDNKVYNNNYDTWDVIYEPGKNEKKLKKKIFKSEKPKLLQGKCMLTVKGTPFPYDPSC
jgi:superfamily II DNA or RNA helicase